MSKWGLRVYSMADSGTGYISVFQPYYGRETTEGLARPEFPFTSRIVLHLIDNQWHALRFITEHSVGHCVQLWLEVHL